MSVVMYNPHNLVQQELMAHCRHLLKNHNEYLKKDRWMSLPELTNKDGEVCHSSCNAQAWSVATITDAVMMIQKESNK